MGKPKSKEEYLDHTKIFMNVIKDLVDSFITFPKLLVALVNGPSVGITAVTTALCDIVFCSKTAYFYTPYSKLALCAEGCASYTFPRLMGLSLANQMLMLNHRMTAEEALRCGLVSKNFEPKDLEEIWKELETYTDLPMQSILTTKRLMRRYDKEELLRVNETEIEEQIKLATSKEVVAAISGFLGRKAKM